nr:phosphoenolpyruvate carboxykinase [Candidatus Brocadiia bacterium]
MELRVHREVGCAEGPTGRVPLFEDLKRLFRETLGKDYSEDDYANQFTIRVAENLAKLDRVEKYHRDNLADAPEALFRVLAEQRGRLMASAKRFGEMIPPDALPRG